METLTITKFRKFLGALGNPRFRYLDEWPTFRSVDLVYFDLSVDFVDEYVARIE